MNILNLTRLFLLTSVLLHPFYVFAQNQTEKLEQDALTYLTEHYNQKTPELRTEIRINPVSRKLNLRPCSHPVLFQPPRGSASRITFRAECSAPVWKIFIVAQVNQFGSAVITRQSLSKNTPLELSHLRVEEINLTQNRSAYFRSEHEIIGWETKRNLAANTILTANMLKPPYAVKKGNAILIEAKRNGVTIRAPGTALQNGQIGEQIKVQNDRSGSVFKAQIIQRGLVQVP